MKKRTTFIGIALLTAVLMLSVGYAAISNVTLNVTGDASASGNDANFKVAFTKETNTTTSNPKSVVTATADNLTATINVSKLETKGDKVTVTYNIKNSSPELSTNLALGELNNSNQTYFKVTQELKDNNLIHGVSTTLTITVELLKTPVSEVNTTINTSIVASPVEG